MASASIIADARALFGAATVLAYRQGQRVARAPLRRRACAARVAGAPGIAPGTWCEFSVELRGHTLQLCSLPGVFAHDRLDAGTQLLIETIAAPQGLRVLIRLWLRGDRCAGGPVGAAQAELTDTNLLAVASAAATLARNRIGAARAYAADGVPAEHAQAYDLILSNPPFHVGKAVAYDVAHAFIAQARRALAPGGQLIVVANQFLRYDQLLHAAFGQVSGLAQTSSYRIWSASCGPGAEQARSPL
ncbi:MAG: methyltransferase [Kouleothrix sp.]